MRIEETFTLDAPVDRAHAFLGDVHRVARCVPGVEDVATRDDGSYEATLHVQLGPIRALFTGELRLTATEQPYRITAAGRGRDRKSGSRAEVDFAGDLEPSGEHSTRVATVADVTIRGRLGQFGTGVIKATATEVIRDFVRCANQSLSAELDQNRGRETPATGSTPDAAPTSPTRRDPVPADQPAPPRGRSVGGLVFRIVLRWVRDIWARLLVVARRAGR